MLSPTITRRLIDHVADSEGERTRHAREQLYRLTEREREVAVAIGLGKSNAAIGRELYMSVATVKAHVLRVLEKLELNNRVQIALLAHDACEAEPRASRSTASSGAKLQRPARRCPR
jgi:DNA-binding NarL/FixJ family response regulator